MKCALVVPRVQGLTTRIAMPVQVPLGHLLVATALKRAGHETLLLDADAERTAPNKTIGRLREFGAEVVLVGHPAATVGHTASLELIAAIRDQLPGVWVAYGGVYPTYHAEQILADADRGPHFVVRHEAEATSAALVDALESGADVSAVRGISFRSEDGLVVNTPPALLIRKLDEYKADWDSFPQMRQYHWYGMKSVVAQFSRGCPKRCGYCGQFDFWKVWRRRSIESFTDEVQRVTKAGAKMICIADENWSIDADLFHRLLTSLAQIRHGAHMVVTMEGDHVIRDIEHLRLYREAGLSMLMIGYDAGGSDEFGSVAKRNPAEKLKQAVEALARVGIIPIINAFVPHRQRTSDVVRRLADLKAVFYNILHGTPHDWTEFGRATIANAIEPNMVRWDYRHPVIGNDRCDLNKQAAFAKWLEVALHVRGLAWLSRRREVLRNELLWKSYPLITKVFGLELAELVQDAVGAAARKIGVGFRSMQSMASAGPLR